MEYQELRKQWIPDEANVLYEEQSGDRDSNIYLVYTHIGKLYIARFFTLGGNWNVSIDVERNLFDLAQYGE